MANITVIIPGDPVAKPRATRQDRWKERPRVMRYRAWADHARAQLTQPLSQDAPTEVEAFVYMAFPSSYSRKKRELLAGMPHLLRPDADNILKAVLDTFWRDNDSFVYDARIIKRWDDGNGPHVKLHISW